ncbi:acyl-CoA dehydrogenase family protein [Zhihengliuella flava]|uniref:Alkylation response protein AidB-like acyl-CoA dehydrogenase n=1 Tax=Zhihengliuella flava TaxID=1285193 RepID=A0A931DDU6_9MICC|nr:acyl-CoA dehydrogenase family protein [Zhihengliuella flava]MBG6084983.1 alkylation response protein AidB-like acyl-CoA dehydrogenase [Zhihengliuella flava]
MTSYEILRERFAPVFERIAAGAWDRDRERVLPHEPIAELNAAGFGALRVPTARGGYGVSVQTQMRLLIDLAAADSNIAHQYRSHFGFVETLPWQSEAVRERWYPRVAAGQSVGNASTERGGNALGTLNTTLKPAGPQWTLTGSKFYCTGTIFADYTRVSAQVMGADGEPTAERYFAVVPVNGPGVQVYDDWDGFGQRLTGTGTTEFDGVAVDPLDVLPRVRGTAEAVHEAAFFQLVLLAVQAGIARNARDDAAALVARRSRTFNTGSGKPFREEDLIQAEVGKIAAKAFAAEATVLAAARAIDAAWDHYAADGFSQEPGRVPAEAHTAELAVEAAHVEVPELVLAAAQALFQTVGASATSTSKGLDRHWRNAQTVATHNPIAFRARSLGDFHINGTTPVGLNAIGEATSSSAVTPSATA